MVEAMVCGRCVCMSSMPKFCCAARWTKSLETRDDRAGGGLANGDGERDLRWYCNTFGWGHDLMDFIFQHIRPGFK